MSTPPSLLERSSITSNPQRALDAGLVVYCGDILAFILLSPIVIFKLEQDQSASFSGLASDSLGLLFWRNAGQSDDYSGVFRGHERPSDIRDCGYPAKLQPVFALLMARFVLGERLSKKFYLWAAAAVVGAYILAFGKPAWNLITLISSVARLGTRW